MDTGQKDNTDNQTIKFWTGDTRKTNTGHKDAGQTDTRKKEMLDRWVPDRWKPGRKIRNQKMVRQTKGQKEEQTKTIAMLSVAYLIRSGMFVTVLTYNWLKCVRCYLVPSLFKK